MADLSETLADNAVYVVLGVVLFALFFLALNGAVDTDGANETAPAGNGSTPQVAADDGGAGNGSVDAGNASVNGSTDGATNDSSMEADADGATAEAGVNTTEVERLIVDGVDRERNASNRSSLTWVRNGSLDDMAVYHTNDMVLKQYLATTSPGGEDLDDRVGSFDPDCGDATVAELIGRVDGATEDGERRDAAVIADAIVSGWATENRGTVTEPNATRIAVAAQQHDDSRMVYVTANLC